MERPKAQKRKRRGGPRRKTASHTCKSRHARCDEKKPVCSNCERLNLECRPSDFIAPSEWNNAFGPAVGIADPVDSEPTAITDVPSSEEVGNMTVSAPTSTWDVFRAHLPGFNMVSEESPTDAHLSMLSLPTPAPTLGSASLQMSYRLTDETAFLLQTYLRTVARWMDLMDFRHTYQVDIPRLTLSSPLLFNCICAFTAKHLYLSNAREHSSWDPIAQRYYGEALRLLISTLNSPSHEHALTATILLSSYEIIAALGSESQRRHFLGTMTLIKNHGISAQSKGIDRANFWIYIRHEIGVALASERPFVLKIEDWNVSWKEGEDREDVLGNQCLWILARIINLIYGQEISSEAGKEQRVDFLNELEEWRSGLPDAFIGIPYGERDEEGLRKTFFTVTAAAAAAFWYHVAHILLYAEPKLQDISYVPYVQDHAMKIASIAVSEFPDSLRVFATHGLFHAAKHIDGLARKARLWGILNDVETQLGYHTRSTVRRLQDLVESGQNP